MIRAAQIAKIRANLFEKIEKTNRPIRDDLKRKYITVMSEIYKLVGNYIEELQKVQFSNIKYLDDSNIYRIISNLGVELKDEIRSRLCKSDTLTQKLLDNFTSTFGEGIKVIDDVENRIKCLNDEPEVKEGLHKKPWVKEYFELFRDYLFNIEHVDSRRMDKKSFEKCIKHGLGSGNPEIKRISEELLEEHNNTPYKK